MFMTLLAAFQALLARASGQDDIAVGSPIAGRNRAEIEPLIGFFVNTLVLRTRSHRRLSLAALLHRVRDTTLSAYAHQDLPFEKLVEQLQPQRDLSRSPLFQVLLVLQNTAPASLQLAGLQAQGFDSQSEMVKADLTWIVQESGGGLGGSLLL